MLMPSLTASNPLLEFVAVPALTPPELQVNVALMEQYNKEVCLHHVAVVFADLSPLIRLPSAGGRRRPLNPLPCSSICSHMLPYIAFPYTPTSPLLQYCPFFHHGSCNASTICLVCTQMRNIWLFLQPMNIFTASHMS